MRCLYLSPSASRTVFTICFMPAIFAAGAAGDDASDGSNRWVDTEKIRCIAYYHSFPSGQEEALIKKAKELGFNSLLTVGNESDQTVRNGLGLAGRHAMRMFVVYNLRNSLNAAALQSAAGRRFTGADGIVDTQYPCPFDEDGWNTALGEPGVAMARLSTQYPAAVGLLFDIEDYSKRNRKHWRGWMDHCFCDHCFDSFCKAHSLETDHEAVSPQTRKDWLSINDNVEQYKAHQHKEAERICRNIRDQVDQINPDFLMACYPWGDSNYFVDYIRGLGTERAPFLLFDYHYRGYSPNFAMRARELAGKDLHVRLVPGQGCFGGVDLGPMLTAAHCYYSAVTHDGYWIYEGSHPILTGQDDWIDSVPGTLAQWQQWIKTANDDLDRRTADANYQSNLPLPRDPLLDPSFRESRNVRQAIPASHLRNRRHSKDTTLSRPMMTDLGIPWAGHEILLHGNEAGDYLEFEVDVPVSDTSVIEGFLGTGPKRGIVQLLVDGEAAGDPVNLYSPKLNLFPRLADWSKRGRIQRLAPLGTATMEAGSHVFRLTVVGRHASGNGYHVGIRGLMLVAITDAPFVNKWLVIGPFPGGDYRGMAERYPPEHEIEPDKTYPGGAIVHRQTRYTQPEHIRWQVAHASAKDWAALQGIRRAGYTLSTANAAEADAWLDFRRVFGAPSGVGDFKAPCGVAYAYTRVHSPRAQLANLLLASASGTRMWVNGEMVWKYEVSGGGVPLPTQVVVSLREGSNDVLIKAEQNWNWPWGLHMRFTDPARELTYDVPATGHNEPD